MNSGLVGEASREEANAEAVATDLLSALLSDSDLAIALLDPVRKGARIVDFRCLLASTAFASSFGGNQDSGLARLLDARLVQRMADVVETGRGFDCERTVATCDEERALRIRVARAGDGVLLSLDDLTPLRSRERLIEQVRQEAEAASKVRMEFLATVSHEMRTPLNTIIGFAEIMKEGLLGQISPPRYNEYIQDIFKAGRHLLGVLDDFLDKKRLEGVVAQSEKGSRGLLDLAPDMICLAREGRIEMINAAGADMLALWPAERAVGQAFSSFVHPDYRELAEDDMSSLMGERHRVPMKFVRSDGKEIDVEVAVMRYREEGRHEAAMIVARDITERNRAIRAVLAREERLRKIMATVAEGIVSMDEGGRIESVNPAAESIFGYSAAELIGLPISTVIPGFHPGRERQEVELGATREAEGRHKRGHAFPVDLAFNELKLADNRLFIAVIHDITRRKQAEQHLRFLASHDSLTGLPNRSLFQERLADAIATANAEGNQVAVLFIDLDNFKKVNDSMGHRFGDLVLQAVAKRLSECVRRNDTVARLGGDEFTVILPAIGDEATASALAQVILSTLFQPFHVEGREIYLSGSVGVALYPAHGEDMANVLRNVDMAAHHAKRGGGNTFKFFSADLGAEALHRATVERGLRHALNRDEMHLCYQPKIDLTNGRIAGAEALLRWTNGELGAVSPAAFIPVAEETGLILPIGTWVIRSACSQIKSWEAIGLSGIPISVNLSARQFHQPDLVDSVREILAETEIDPALLELELTESMLVDNAEAAIAVMRGLKNLGISLSIDDFGTGYSSLAYLKRFPVDALKIDRSFVKDIPEDKDDAAIACAIINLARTLQLKIVAEGVEKEDQAAFLRGQNCHLGQGFLWGRPVPAADFLGQWAPSLA